MEYVVFGDSKKGTAHRENEDAILIDGIRNLYAVADGLTIPSGGKEASNRTMTYLKAEFDGKLKKAIEITNERLNKDKSMHDVGYTTITAAKITNDKLEIANVGDSPAFLIRDGKIRMLTVMDSFFDMNLTQALGQPEVNVHVSMETLKVGDHIILASDGITKVLTEDELLDIVKKYQDPKKIVQETLLAASEEPQSYDDDKTMIIIYISE